MRITDAKGVSPKQGVKKTDNKSSSGVSFDDFIGGGDVGGVDAAVSSAVQASESVSSLLFVQEMADNLENYKEGVNQGFDMLGHLDNLRVSLVSGAVDEKDILALKDIVDNVEDNVLEPELRLIIDEIKTRVYVEIAKVER